MFIDILVNENVWLIIKVVFLKSYTIFHLKEITRFSLYKNRF